MSDEFRLKLIEFNGKTVSILLQNHNGPCPLLGIANVLILRDKIRFHPDICSVSLKEVIDEVANVVFEINHISSDALLASQQTQQLQSVIDLIPLLQRGLDINVKFSDADKFEYTQEFDVFDAFGVSLYHGWVIDPQATETYQVVKDLSYNQLTTLVAEYRANTTNTSTDTATISTSPSEDSVKGSLMDTFLSDTATQLTFFGLMRLYELVKDRELAIFFRNDHFSTLYRNKDKLYTLVTDLGYEDEAHVVWELLDNIDGNTEYVSGVFLPHNQLQAAPLASQDMDLILAMQLADVPAPPRINPSTPVQSTDNFNFTTTTVKRPTTATSSSKHMVGRVQPPSRPQTAGTAEYQKVSSRPAVKGSTTGAAGSKSTCLIS